MNICLKSPDRKREKRETVHESVGSNQRNSLCFLARLRTRAEEYEITTIKSQCLVSEESAKLNGETLTLKLLFSRIALTDRNRNDAPDS